MVDSVTHVRKTGTWESVGDTYVRGAAFVDGVRRDAGELAETLADTDSVTQFRDAIAGWNGFYAVVHGTDTGTVAAVDRVQTMPLFYGIDGGTVYVSDDATWIREEIGTADYDPLAEAEFLLTGYVTGGETLYPDIYQLQAGEMVTIDEGGVETDRYFRYHPRATTDGSEAELLDRLDGVVTRVFERAIDVADGRTIVVPLSGGHDSRLIALMLTRMGYDDVIAMSWGKSWDSEHKVSKRIAGELGIDWEYVEYTNDRWHDWFHSAERERYYDDCFDYAALPGLTNMAWPAIRELKRSGRVPDDAIYMPGHTVASMSEHLHDDVLDADRIGKDRVVERLRSVNYRLWDWEDDLDGVLYDLIESRLSVDAFADPADAASAYEEWDWQERQAKFINADLYVYDHWGYDWWMPLWDDEYVDFWQSLPLEVRCDKRLHETYVETLYMDETGVDIGQAQETEKSSPVRQVHDYLFHSPLFEIVRPVYTRLRYDADPRGWPGIMPRKQFNELFTGRERAYSFFALEVLDRIEFDPPRNVDVPEDGVLRVDLDEDRIVESSTP